jgi:hypothetical protein
MATRADIEEEIATYTANFTTLNERYDAAQAAGDTALAAQIAVGRAAAGRLLAGAQKELAEFPVTVPPAQLTGTADGDASGSSGTTTAGAANVTSSPTTTSAPSTDTTPLPTAPNTSTQSSTKPSSPDKRLENPLGNFSSYTYHLTLYMINPDAYETFILSDRTNIGTISSVTGGNTGGAYVIAQSGGTNNTSQKRAPGFELDFYIDDLKIKAATNGKSTQSAANITDMSFNIFEPYGFSFITKLSAASAALAANSKSPNYSLLTNPTRQLFILGISFMGYDANGNVVSSKDVTATNNKDAASSVIADRFYDITIKGMKFKIDGKATTYSISAVALAPQTAYGMKHGRANHGASIIASTVAEALGGQGSTGTEPSGTNVQGLLTMLNAEQQARAKPTLRGDKTIAPEILIPNVYKIRYLDAAATEIANASMINLADVDKSKWPMSTAQTGQQSNEATSVKGIPVSNSRTLNFKDSTSITQIINTVISQSSYLTDALTVIQKSTEEAGSSPDAKPVVLSGTRNIKWYNLGSEVKCLGWDKNVGDFAYEITYVIQPYETPAAISVYSNANIPYYGPAKRYSYWFTGKNSEILSYEQSLDNSYFNVALGPSGTDASHGNGAQISTTPDTKIAGDNTGKQNLGMQTQNSYVTNLYDPGSWAKAKISILGDPDFLIQDSPSSINAVYSRFYGKDGFTINANGGQVFIEIDFKEAVDYTNSNGLMSINESIQFWKYPPDVAKMVTGVSYMVIDVVSNFSKGKFTQDLTATVNPMTAQISAVNNQAARESTAELTREGRRASPSNAPDEPRQNNISAYVAPQETVANTTGTVPVAAPFNAATDSQLANLPPAFNAATDSQAASVVQDDDSSYNSIEAVRLARLNAANATASDAGRETITAETNTGRAGR